MSLKRFSALSSVAAAALLLAACGQQDEANSSPSRGAAKLDSEAAKFSYAVGVDLGESLGMVRDEVDLDALVRGIDDAFAEREPAMSQSEREEAKAAVAQRLQQAQQEEMASRGAESAEKGRAYLEENAGRDGVTVTDSGLQIEFLEEGEGNKPSAEDTVTVHYRGTLIDGTEFDSSYNRGQPATFPLGNVIAGWTEGLQLMPEGSKARLVIPAELAYGDRGAGDRIGPNETLIFEVELLSIKD